MYTSQRMQTPTQEQMYGLRELQKPESAATPSAICLKRSRPQPETQTTMQDAGPKQLFQKAKKEHEKSKTTEFL